MCKTVLNVVFIFVERVLIEVYVTSGTSRNRFMFLATIDNYND